MGNWTDLESFKRFAESLVKDCQEGVKWERRKLEWIREERAAQQKSGESEAA